LNVPRGISLEVLLRRDRVIVVAALAALTLLAWAHLQSLWSTLSSSGMDMSGMDMAGISMGADLVGAMSLAITNGVPRMLCSHTVDVKVDEPSPATQGTLLEAIAQRCPAI
jgi:predicted metal-binding membrane protein